MKTLADGPETRRITDPEVLVDDRGRSELHTGYAGFVRRAAALLIDAVVLAAASAILSLPVALIGQRFEWSPETISACSGTLTTVLILLYFAGLESSTSQGTLGKMALGLQVTDLGGRPIRFQTALFRTVAKLVSLMPFGIGFLMAAFEERRQGLHDWIVKTLVLRVR